MSAHGRPNIVGSSHPPRPVDRMPRSGTTPMRARLNNYTAYSIGCAGVWAAILLAAQRLADAETRKTMQLACAAWWSGWTSATIARVAYPPPKKLGSRSEKALQVTSVPMIALGIGSAIRFVWAGRKHR
jgi:hypothetical protein